MRKDQITEWRILDCMLEDKARRYNIDQAQLSLVRYFLTSMIEHGIDNPGLHSYRVGLKAADIAEYTGFINPKAVIWPGLLHDVGKLRIRKELFGREINHEEMREIRKHVQYGYEILEEAGLHFSAAVLARTHTNQRASYPEVLPPMPFNSSGFTAGLVEMVASIVSIADAYDSSLSRKNSRAARTRQEAIARLMADKPHLSYLISNLVDAKII